MSFKFLRKSKLDLINGAIVDLGTPANFSVMWNFFSLLGLILIVQLATGVLLTFHYAANVSVAFDSVIHIERDVNMGWLLRYSHINGASFFFVFIYIHIGRGIYFFSFKKLVVWGSGVVILLVLMMVAFMGYILPWGQMSFWGATVITNLISSIPYWGTVIVQWIWGGFSVSNATLNRFFSFHFLFPFILLVLVLVHLLALHQTGSSNPLGTSSSYDKIFFYPYFAIKDLLGYGFASLVYFSLVCFSPLILVDCENFIMANSLVTPVHIQPEWYYLFSYAILRSIPSKLGGVVALFLSILILFVLVFVESKFNSAKFYPLLDYLFFWFGSVVLMLMWIGANQVESPYYLIGQMGTCFFFFFFFFWIYFTLFWDGLLNL
uniref:Cytochrome b n=1 Tax=Aleurocanthus spiniferus TaxID=593793 RepID=A0A0X8UZI0_ALESP|nr:cytochrome b [Aleurocanthus spiniferus]AHY04223.1 cytochrome b [Aleurocanthus spiniferus]